MVFMNFQIEFPRAFLCFNRYVSSAFGILLAVMALQPLFADGPAARTAGTKSDVKIALELKPEHGPWLVFAMSFDGYNAKSQAEQLAIELRRDYKLQAYCMDKKLDYTQPLIGAGVDTNGNNRKMKFRDKKVIDGYAVLVGDFDSIDSPAITEALASVKKILKKKSNSPDKVNCFTTRNPMLPDDYYKTPEVDRFVKKLNEQREHSEFNLLECPGKFTVRVAVFSGEDRAIGGWGGSGSHDNIDDQKLSQLEVAAERAALTAKALRIAGYEAYQFHDRTKSIVTVGSFNELGRDDKSNRFAYDPAIQKIVARFGATSQQTRSAYGLTQTPRLLFDLVEQKQIPEINEGNEKSKLKWFTKYSVAFDLKPTPMAVPKPAASSIYSGSLLGKDRR